MSGDTCCSGKGRSHSDALQHAPTNRHRAAMTPQFSRITVDAVTTDEALGWTGNKQERKTIRATDMRWRRGL